jgi:para-nitrobenzyl esterase
LNVWTAAATAKERRPVMVWIHGGGLTNGMSWETLSHGTKLAPEGVVLVTIAYRLGALGFLAHSELTRESGHASGNYGLFDAVAALKWVQANIAQFGGDPSRVTIFGGSSGALMVSLLAGAPAAKGLYTRAIAQGGEFGADPPKLLAQWLKFVIDRSRCTETQAAIAAIYPPTRDAPTNTPTNMNRYLFRDFYTGWPDWTWARLQSTARGDFRISTDSRC